MTRSVGVSTQSPFHVPPSMSTSRLTFLYPHLFRGARLSESAAQTTRASPACRPGNLAAALPAFAPSPPPRRTSTFAKRHGKAVEPLPLHAVPKAPPPATSAAGTELGAKEPHSKKEKSPRNAEATEKTKQSIAASEAVGKGAEEEVEKVVEEKKRLAPPETTSDGGGRGRGLDQAQADAQAKDAPAACELAPGPKPKSGEPPGTSGPMDAILHMGPPASSSPPPPASSGSGAAESDESPHRAPPHLSPRPYVHHFDSYSLVKQLEAGGWTRAQAITAMKAVRGLLAENLDMAQAGLVSKSDVENEAYLFRAACSELSTEVRNNRRVADEGMRQQRTHLQHEVDILTQKLNQELLTLSDNVKGIFNDRRMAVREEQTAAESVVSPVSTYCQ